MAVMNHLNGFNACMWRLLIHELDDGDVPRLSWANQGRRPGLVSFKIGRSQRYQVSEHTHGAKDNPYGTIEIPRNMCTCR